jgi:hypothetical protein
MAIYRVTGSERRVEYFPKKASQAFSVNSLVTFSGGEVQPAVATDLRMGGICLQKIASTDSDYASETPIGIELIDPNAVYIGDVSTGTLTTESVGIQYDLASATGIDVSATSHKQVTCVGFISATKGYFMINGLFQTVPAV